MTWQIYLAISILFLSLGPILSRVLMRGDETDSLAVAFGMHLINSVIVTAFVFATGQLDFSGMEKIIPNLLIMMILLAVFWITSFKALKTTEASKFVVIFSLKPVFTILASTILLAEGLAGKQFFGFGLILLAVALVTLKDYRIKLGRGELLALLAAIIIGLVNTNDRISLGYVKLAPYILVSNLLPLGLLTLLILPKIKVVVDLFQKQRLIKLVTMCVVQLLGISTMLGAFQLTKNSSQVASLLDLSIVLTVIMGVVFLKERDNLWQKLLGALVGFVGLVFVS